MKNVKLLKNKIKRFIELKIYSQAQTKPFAIQSSSVDVLAWQKITTQNVRIKHNNNTLEHLNLLLDDLIVNEECIHQLVSDIQVIRAYEKQLIELMHQVNAENNNKLCQLNQKIKPILSNDHIIPEPQSYEPISTKPV